LHYVCVRVCVHAYVCVCAHACVLERVCVGHDSFLKLFFVSARTNKRHHHHTGSSPEQRASDSLPHSVPTQSEEERAARQHPKPRDVVYDVFVCV